MQDQTDDNPIPTWPEPSTVTLSDAIRILAEQTIEDFLHNEDRYDTDSVPHWEVCRGHLYGDLGRVEVGRVGFRLLLEQAIPPADQLLQVIALARHHLQMP
jgi:hypothetical protein